MADVLAGKRRDAVDPLQLAQYAVNVTAASHYRVEHHPDSIDVVFNVCVEVLHERRRDIVQAGYSVLIRVLQDVRVAHDLQDPEWQDV